MARASRGPARAGVLGLLLLVASSVLVSAVPVAVAVPAAGQVAGVTAAPPLAKGSSLAELKAEVARSSKQLADATSAWQRGQLRLGLEVQRKVAAERALEALQHQAVDARSDLRSLANSLYRNPVSPLLMASFSGDQRLMTDTIYLRRRLNQDGQSLQQSATLLAERETRALALLDQQQAAALAVTRMQTRLDEQLGALQAEAVASNARLQKLLAELRAREAARAAGSGGGATCSSEVPPGAVNGFLPESSLCFLRTAPRHRLVARAARAFDEMSLAFARETGDGYLCVTDSYRDYAAQVDVFRRKPNLAATPGRSQHGWGLAVDLCGGVQQFGAAAHQWMKARAPQFGFVHPDWAEPDGSRPEPWHWEFRG